jgi:hypothetical protein
MADYQAACSVPAERTEGWHTPKQEHLTNKAIKQTSACLQHIKSLKEKKNPFAVAVILKAQLVHLKMAN